MSIIEIESGPLRIGVLPSLGAGLTEFSWRDGSGTRRPLMRPAPQRPAWFNDLSCYLLAPWSNRIAGASFRYGGKERVLRADWPDGTAIHGDVKTRVWRILDRAPGSARLAYESSGVKDSNWPWRFGAEVRYELSDDRLRIDLAVRNAGSQPFPAGVGFHPFWQRTVNGHEARITLRTTGRYPCEKMIPTQPARADAVSRRLALGESLGTEFLDDCFAGFDGAARIEWGPLAAAFECSPRLGHAVVYSPVVDGVPGESFCLEPVSMVNDGFRLKGKGWPGTGVREVAPGDELRVWWTVRVGLGGRTADGATVES